MLEWWNWYTRTTQNRMPQGLGVQVSPPAQKYGRKCEVFYDNIFVVGVGLERRTEYSEGVRAGAA